MAGSVISDFFNFRKQAIEEDKLAHRGSKYRFSASQAYLLAIAAAFISLIIYMIIEQQDIRYSTLLTISVIVFFISMMLLDSPERHFYRIVGTLLLALIIFEVIGYEILRIMKDRNRSVALENVFTSKNS